MTAMTLAGSHQGRTNTDRDTAPAAIISVAILTVVGRFRRFDPVSVVERRLV